MVMIPYGNFERHALDGTHWFFTGRLPEELLLDQSQFEALWNLHPEQYHEIMMHGRLVKTPRWQQTYGSAYRYTGRVNEAKPTPLLVEPFLDWVKTTIDRQSNGILLNWYDGRLRHYIGAHRDSREQMVVGSPIVTISLGEDRIFRLRPWKTPGFRDFAASNGTVFIMPYETNLAWKHEVPHAPKYQGRRISITLRAFTDGRSGDGHLRSAKGLG